MKKYWSIFITQIINNLAYPGELFWRGTIIIIFMWIFSSLWRVTYSVTDAAATTGLSLRDTMWYFMLAEVIELSKPRLSAAISSAVKDGSIAYLLNKPFNFLLYQFSSGMGDSLVRALMNLLLGTVTVWLLVGSPPGIFGWLLAIPTILLSWSLHYCFNALVGLAAFVAEEVAPYEWIYQKFVQVLGGLFIPLDFFPLWLKNIALALPFASMLYGPARLFVKPTWPDFLSLIGIQSFWLLILVSVLALAYRKSVTYLTVNGG
jgi:ABC-2 type transport system permease protein